MSWNRPNTVPSALSPTGVGKKKSIIRGAIAGAIVVAAVICAAVYFLTDHQTQPAKRPSQTTSPKTSRERQVSDTKTELTQAAIAARAAAETAGTTNREMQTEAVVPYQTNAVHNAESVIILKDGSRYVPKKQIFHKPIERMFSKAIQPARAPGSMPCAVMFAERYTDEELIKMMKEKVVIKPDDTPAMVNAKLDVQELKDKVLKHVAEGGSVRDIFEEIDNQAMDEHRENHFTQVGLREARRFGDPEVTKAWIAKRNERLRELGMPEIPNEDLPEGETK